MQSCLPRKDIDLPLKPSICPVFINNPPWQSHTHSTTKATDSTLKTHLLTCSNEHTHKQVPFEKTNAKRLSLSSCPEELPPAQTAPLAAPAQHPTVPSFPKTAGQSLDVEKLIFKTSPSSHPEACSQGSRIRLGSSWFALLCLPQVPRHQSNLYQG